MKLASLKRLVADSNRPVWQRAGRQEGYNECDDMAFLQLRAILMAAGLLTAGLLTAFTSALILLFGAWGCVAAFVASLAAGLAGLSKLSHGEVAKSAAGLCILVVASGNLLAAPMVYFTPLKPMLILVLAMSSSVFCVLAGAKDIKRKTESVSKRQAKAEDRTDEILSYMLVAASLVGAYFLGGLTFVIEALIVVALSVWIGYCITVSDELPRSYQNVFDSAAWVFGYPFYLLLAPVRWVLKRGG